MTPFFLFRARKRKTGDTAAINSCIAPIILAVLTLTYRGVFRNIALDEHTSSAMKPHGKG